MSKILLATQSPYKKQLFERLRLPFETCNPDIDESRKPLESVVETVCRLAEAKALAANEIVSGFDLIIGADQLASHKGGSIGKPKDADGAIEQLLSFSGETVEFHTGICVYSKLNGVKLTKSIVFAVSFRHLCEAEVSRYVATEKPLDCAGSFKSEGLGITLFEKMRGDDPTSLIGLPLIALSDMLRQLNISLP